MLIVFLMNLESRDDHLVVLIVALCFSRGWNFTLEEKEQNIRKVFGDSDSVGG